MSTPRNSRSGQKKATHRVVAAQPITPPVQLAAQPMSAAAAHSSQVPSTQLQARSDGTADPAPALARPQRKAKADALSKKVWTADATRSRKRASSTAGNDMLEMSSKKTKVSRTVTNAAVVDASRAARRPKPRPINKQSRTTEVVTVSLESDDEVPLAAQQDKIKAQQPVKQKTRGAAAIVVRSAPTFIPDDNADFAATVQDDDNASSVSDEDKDSAEYSSGDSDSQDGLDVNGTRLAAQLMAEQPAWTTESSGKQDKGKGKAPLTVASNDGRLRQSIPQVALSDLDDSDHSEYAPEGEPEEFEDENEDLEEDGEEVIDVAKMVEQDPTDDEGLMAAALRPRANIKKRTQKSAANKAREQVEWPVWKDSQTTTVSGPGATTASTSHPGPVVAHTAPQGSSTQARHTALVVPRAAKAPTTRTQAAPLSPSLFNSDVEDNEPEAHLGGSTGGITAPSAQATSTTVHPAAPAMPAAVAAPGGDDTLPRVLPAASYTIVPSAHPGGVLSLNAQDPHVRETIRAAFISLEADLVFVDSFPNDLGRSHTVAKALREASNTLGLHGLTQRLNTDDTFLRALSALPKQRISTFRSSIKKITDAHVLVHYDLNPTECEEKIPKLFAHMNYIYPGARDILQRSVPYNSPYQNPVLDAVLRTAFFTGQSSIAHKHPYRFMSSLPQRSEEREVPMAMLALVGAAVHASLSEWKTGTFKSISFSADSYLDVYHEHITLLRVIKEKNVRAYHKMMHRLYNLASGTVVVPATTAGNAVDVIDIDGMDVD